MASTDLTKKLLARFDRLAGHRQIGKRIGKK